MKHNLEQNQMEVQREEAMQLFELCDDCLREICDHLDVRDLCAFAGTCRNARSIARRAFASRKVNQIEYSADTDDLKVANGCIFTSHIPLYLRLFDHFHESLHSVKIAYICSDPVSLARVAEHSARRSKGAVHTLHLDGRYHCFFEWPRVANALLPQLRTLRMESVSHSLSFGICWQLTRLDIEFGSAEQEESCMNAWFPKLQSIRFSYYSHRDPRALGQFLQRHRSTLLDMDIDSNDDLSALADAEHCDRLAMPLNTPRNIGWITHKRLKSLELVQRVNGSLLSQLLDEATELRETLEHLKWSNLVNCSLTPQLWLCLARMHNLQVLHIYVDKSFSEIQLIEGMEFLMNRSKCIRDIEIRMTILPTYARSNYHRIDRIGKQRNCAITIRGQYYERGNAATISEKFDRYETFGQLYTVWAFFGKH